MIKQWRVTRFKSVRDPLSVSFSALTVLAGTNSSGKSSLIQSILLVAQTLATPISTIPIVLNGHLVRLGRFSSLKTGGTPEQSVCIGFDLSLDLAAPTAFTAPDDEMPENVRCDLEFGLDPHGGDAPRQEFQPLLFRAEVAGSTADGVLGRSVIVTRHASAGEPPPPDLDPKTIDTAFAPPEVRYAATLDIDSLHELDPALADAHIDCSLAHFLPRELLIHADARAIYANYMTDLITDPDSARYPPELVRRVIGSAPVTSHVIPQSAIELLKNSLPPEILDDFKLRALPHSPKPKFVDYQRLLRAVRHRNAVVTALRSVRKDVLAAVTSGLPEDVRIIPISNPAALDALVGSVRSFPTSIHYLGPLRAEPRAVHGGTPDPTLIVGLKGEHTASVLHYFRDLPISYISSASVCGERPERTVTTLNQAVLDWLRYMDMAVGVDTLDQGSLGFELRVNVRGNNESHDLTQVGVGLSQVLPIVVLCLIAREGATLLLEQPELHLHPRTQALLGDFLLSVAQCGKQCIVETHSDHLLNRFRRRVAESPGSSVADLLSVYFIEHYDGQSHFRGVEINRFGAIREWPRGFFDQGQFEAQEILRAAASKRKAGADNVSP
jgi:predicted ATPase